MKTKRGTQCIDLYSGEKKCEKNNYVCAMKHKDYYVILLSFVIVFFSVLNSS